MAMYVNFQNGRSTQLHYIGDYTNNSHRMFSDEEIDKISTVQADCDELDLILDCFENIPHTNGRVQVFVGDIAKMIVANWHMLKRPNGVIPL